MSGTLLADKPQALNKHSRQNPSIVINTMLASRSKKGQMLICDSPSSAMNESELWCPSKMSNVTQP